VKVLKFGGSSLGTPERIASVVSIVSDTNRYPTGSVRAVVVSAFQGVTDTLLSLATQAERQESGWNEGVKALEKRHLDAIHALTPATDRGATLAAVKTMCNELADLLHGVALVGECSPRVRDAIVSFGERFCALIVSKTCTAQGYDVELLDAREVICTDENFGNARIDKARTYELIQRYFIAHPALQIVTGFIGSSPSGSTTTLGRGGSDYTASIVGAALKAAEIEIWTDVDGMLTADPRKVSKAFPIPEVTFEEALELCHFGAKVIYPPTIQPAIETKIPIFIKNTFNPSSTGTRISADATRHPYAITGISSVSRLALIRLEGSGMVGVSGTAMRFFRALASRSINVILITQASSEHTICCAIEASSVTAAREATNEEFHAEVTSGLISPLVVEEGVTIVSVVGERMRNTPGMAGRVFGALGSNGINVIAIAQGSSELSISAVIQEQDEAKALSTLHDEFFYSSLKTINLWVVGTGLVGSTLLKQLEAQATTVRETLSIDIALRGAANSRSMQLADGAATALSFTTALDTTTSPAFNLQTFLDHIVSSNLPHSVFVDCTASAEIPTHYLRLFQRSIAVVTPNKRGPASALPEYRSLVEASRLRRTPFLYETCVGAALPVLSTLRDLITSGDSVHRIEAILSGTMSYIFNRIAQGARFSDAVREAKAHGYTEPDPRDDLSGADVARKVLILAREAGIALEAKDLSLSAILPTSALDLSLDEFMKNLELLDTTLAPALVAAQERNQRLFFAATIDCKAQRAEIGIKAVGLDHPFCSLQGSDNIVSFTTARYTPQPLVVKGPGAGAEVTAAGVFADIVRVAR
jgi:aspartokinase/homoserine dehydrogenase 1